MPPNDVADPTEIVHMYHPSLDGSEENPTEVPRGGFDDYWSKKGFQLVEDDDLTERVLAAQDAQIESDNAAVEKAAKGGGARKAAASKESS